MNASQASLQAQIDKLLKHIGRLREFRLSFFF
jgi:hypothetical protein